MVTWTARLPASPPDVVAQRVKEAEQALGVQFPPAFVAIASKYPMAEPDPKNIIINDFGTAVGHLLHFESKSDFHHIANRGFPVADVVDKGIVPFAEDIGGDLYCFDYRAKDAVPSVHYWSVDTGLVALTDSFEAFLNLLIDTDTVVDRLVSKGKSPSNGQELSGA